MKQTIGLKQNVEYVLRDKNGKIKSLWNEYDVIRKMRERFGWNLPRLPIFGYYSSSLKIHNLVTNAGAAGVASRINGSGSEAAFTYIAMGTGTTAAAVGNTTLETELSTVGLSRAAATASRSTTDVTNDTAQLDKTFTITGTAAVTESGVLNASSGGVLLARQVFSAINVVNTDTLAVTWKFDVD